MKKIITFLALISMMTVFAVGCGGKTGGKMANRSERNNTVEENINEGKKTENQKDTVTDKNNDSVNVADEVVNEGHDINEDKLEDKKDADTNDTGYEQVIYGIFEAMKNGDIEKARQYVLYDNLEPPFSSLESTAGYFKNNELLEITNAEEVSENLMLVHMKVGTKESPVDDAYLLKKVDNNWIILLNGVTSWKQSVYKPDQFKDDSVTVYLKDIYHLYNDKDVYVIEIVNNTNQKFNFGFVNYGGFIYELENNEKGYAEMQELSVTDPYSTSNVYFFADTSDVSIKSITLTETMLGLQSKTGETQVMMGDMIEK